MAYRILGVVIDYCKQQLDDPSADSSTYKQALRALISACQEVQKYH